MPTTMNTHLESAIKALMDEHTEKIIASLSERYGFNKNEAMSALAAEAPKTSKAKQVRVKAPEATKMKRGANSFILWAKENRAEVKDNHSEMTGREVTKELGRIWKEEVDDDTKADWKAKAGGSSSEEEDVEQ